MILNALDYQFFTRCAFTLFFYRRSHCFSADSPASLVMPFGLTILLLLYLCCLSGMNTDRENTDLRAAVFFSLQNFPFRMMQNHLNHRI
jgi:hypothetical protein